SNTALPSLGVINVLGGTLDIGANNETAGNVQLQSGSIIGSGVLTANNYDAQSGLLGASLAGTAALTKTTGGAVTLTGASTYTGGTNVNNGTLFLGTANVLPAGGAVTVNGGAINSPQAQM